MSKQVFTGLANSTSYSQSTVEPLFQEMRNNMKAWLNDFNLHAGNEEKLMDLLEKFFQICEIHGLFLLAKKCVFLTSKGIPQ